MFQMQPMIDRGVLYRLSRAREESRAAGVVRPNVQGRLSTPATRRLQRRQLWLEQGGGHDGHAHRLSGAQLPQYRRPDVDGETASRDADADHRCLSERRS